MRINWQSDQYLLQIRMCGRLCSPCRRVDKFARDLLTRDSKFDTLARLALIFEALLGFVVIVKVACEIALC